MVGVFIVTEVELLCQSHDLKLVIRLHVSFIMHDFPVFIVADLLKLVFGSELLDLLVPIKDQEHILVFVVHRLE